MSKLSSSDCATRLTSAASKLTPRLILPDLTTVAREVTLRITASSEAESPVVPMTCTRPRSAAIATLAMVAPGTVKSRMPSAFADNAHRSAEILTSLAGSPASTPASLPRSSEPGASSAPARIAPGVSAMTRVSARPIRPPAPATIRRMSDICLPHPRRIAAAGCSGNRPAHPSGLRAVKAFDDHEIGFGVRAADLDQAGIFRRIVTGERGLIVLEFKHHIARARRAFLGDEATAANQEFGAIFRKHRAILRDISLVAVHVVNVEPRHPVPFCHWPSPFFSPVPGRFLPGSHPPPPWDRKPPPPDVLPPDNPPRR